MSNWKNKKPASQLLAMFTSRGVKGSLVESAEDLLVMAILAFEKQFANINEAYSHAKAIGLRERTSKISKYIREKRRPKQVTEGTWADAYKNLNDRERHQEFGAHVTREGMNTGALVATQAFIDGAECAVKRLKRQPKPVRGVTIRRGSDKALCGFVVLSGIGERTLQMTSSLKMVPEQLTQPRGGGDKYHWLMVADQSEGLCESLGEVGAERDAHIEAAATLEAAQVSFFREALVTFSKVITTPEEGYGHFSAVLSDIEALVRIIKEEREREHQTGLRHKAAMATRDAEIEELVRLKESAIEKLSEHEEIVLQVAELASERDELVDQVAIEREKAKSAAGDFLSQLNSVTQTRDRLKKQKTDDERLLRELASEKQELLTVNKKLHGKASFHAVLSLITTIAAIGFAVISFN